MLVIDINKLTNGTVYMIAKDLGCKIEYPSIKWGKYTPGYMAMLSEKEYQELIKSEKFKQEQERLNEEQDRDIEEFYDSLGEWLEENGYLIEE